MTYLFLFYVYGYFCLPFCLCSMCIQCPQKPEEGVSPPRTGITGGPSSACWEPNLDALQVHAGSLTWMLFNSSKCS